MTVLSLSLIVLLGALAMHLVWWRIRLPRRQTRAIIFITLGAYLLVLGLAALAGGAWSVSLAQAIHVAFIVLPVLGAYVISYSALEADSPTLVMMLLLDRAGPRGMEEAAFLAALDDDLLVIPRINDLVRDGMAGIDDKGRYRLRRKGLALVRFVGLHRKLLGREAGG